MTTPPRTANACESCRRRKVKCSGSQPCRSCTRHNWECVFGGSGRSRYSETHVRGLLDRIRVYEERIAVLERASFQNTPAEPEIASYPDNGISPATDLTSGPAFESQVRSLLDQTHPEHNDSQWTSARPLVNEATAPTIPSLSESQHLLDRFLFYLGVSQHFFDPRMFSDSMMLLFQSPQQRDYQMRSTWFTEYLLVMAMAKLMDVDEPTSQPPGANLFAEAMRRLPPLHQLGEEGVIAVEILTLVTTYLQWCDRKHDAYLYIGLALRLAIALGCDRPAHEQSCLPSETAHRVRLWWTVYMLDRRLSSGLGLAAGADERQLCSELPRHAIGFQSPVALSINVRIARTTDDIMSSLYGNTSITQIDLVQKIQKILHDLYETGRSFPPALVLDFNRPLQTVTRTGASLYLMLFQAIILCVRPILLQRVRQKVRKQHDQLPLSPVPAVLTRLCETCNEAATKSLAILYSLQRQRTIPRYGFFDLDATFSAAFVLVMMGFVDKDRARPPALDQALEVLRFLARAGNLAAEKRLHDITQSCSRVWPDQIQPETTNFSPQQTEIYDPSDESRLLETWMHAEGTSAPFEMQPDWNLDLAVEAEGIYESFYDPTMPLTGVDYLDWAEIEKVFNENV
ncbi:hypothetical protein MW887_005864 [Aspergillus wentii]|nr:hypothetical protein MW887_005864 [Aspergillus wentii]